MTLHSLTYVKQLSSAFTLFVNTVPKRSLRSQTSNISKWKQKKSENTAENEETANTSSSKKTQTKQKILVSGENQYEKLAEAVTPLWKLPYDEQLNLKHERQKQHLENFYEELRKKGTNVSKHSILSCLSSIVPSPVINNYRNKDEFNIRQGLDGKPVAGFFVGSPSTGGVQCIGPEKLINVKPSHVEIAKRFEQYVRSSQWQVCEHFQKGGNWRSIIVRSNSAGDVMATVIVHPQQLSSTEIEHEMENLKTFFLNGEGKHESLKSLYYQACPHTRCTPEQSPFRLLFGEPYLLETVEDFKFRISPDSFFQVNTAAAAVLYKTVSSLLRASRMTTVLDLCCGTGTQGLFTARKARSVIGIELSSSAVKDARQNAALNGVTNAEYYVGRVENMLKPILDQLETAADIAAIVNPARAGLGYSVIKGLRECNRIQRLVYVSCFPEGTAMDNFVQLCRKADKKHKGTPFRLVEAIPVDMFPHTNHCELVLSFERKS